MPFAILTYSLWFYLSWVNYFMCGITQNRLSLLFFLITVKKTKINFEIPTFYLQCPKNNHPLFCTKPRVCIEKNPYEIEIYVGFMNLEPTFKKTLSTQKPITSYLSYHHCTVFLMLYILMLVSHCCLNLFFLKKKNSK